MQEVTKEVFKKCVKNKTVNAVIYNDNIIHYKKNDKIVAICETTEIDGIPMTRFLKRTSLYSKIKNYLIKNVL